MQLVTERNVFCSIFTDLFCHVFADNLAFWGISLDSCIVGSSFKTFCLCCKKYIFSQFPFKKMSSYLRELENRKFYHKLNVVNPPLSYTRQQNVDRFAIALALEIPYPLLQLWHSIVNKNDDQGNSCDYFDLLNSWIPNKWFRISWETGFCIQGRLR